MLKKTPESNVGATADPDGTMARAKALLSSTQSPLKSRELGQCPTTRNGYEYSRVMSPEMGFGWPLHGVEMGIKKWRQGVETG